MAGGLLQGLRRNLRELRRRTLLGPLLDAWAFRGVLVAIVGDLRELRVLAPEEFSIYLRCLVPLGTPMEEGDVRAFDWVIVPQERLSSLSAPALRGLRDHFRCVFENRRYLLFRAGSAPQGRAGTVEQRTSMRLAELVPTANAGDPPRPQAFTWTDRAILVTTFERPVVLERTLPQLARLGAPILVVDDGSRESLAERNLGVARTYGAQYLRLPTNRGLSAALTAGLEYLLADSRLHWISYFQDDVNVQPDALDVVHRVEDAVARPLLTGYDADEHPTLAESEVCGVAVRLRRETAGVHLHAHRDYWREVLPIPTEYLGAPKRRWEGSLEDSWITVGAPNAAARRGISVVCIPGLVQTFLWHHGDSTWGNRAAPRRGPGHET